MTDTRFTNHQQTPHFAETLVSVFMEFLYSLPVGIYFFASSGSSVAFVRVSVAWLTLGTVTGIARYAGNMTRRECSDLRFMFYSLHSKIPVWVNWVFWLALAGVLVKPLFALTVYIGVAFAFNRGYRNCKPERTFLIFVIIDIVARMIGGWFLMRPGFL